MLEIYPSVSLVNPSDDEKSPNARPFSEVTGH